MMHRWTCLIWVVWVSMGVIWFAEATHRNTQNPFGNPRHNDVMTGPSATLVEALRQLLGLPKEDFRKSSHPYDPPPRPPRYMLDLYRKISQGGSSLPRHANTVRSFKPRTDDKGDMLLYNVSAMAREQVLGAWLHLRGSSGRGRLSPRLRPSRILVYLFPDVTSRYSTKAPSPIMMHTLSPHQQEIELTRGVREVIEDTEKGRLNSGFLGIRVEELRRGRYVSRAPEKLARRPPLLFVYSSDPALLDLQALGAAALNISKVTRPQTYSRTTHLKRYTRGTGEDLSQNEEESDRSKRFIDENDWLDAEMEAEEEEEEDEEDEEEEEDEMEAMEEEEEEDEEDEEDEEEREVPSPHRNHHHQRQHSAHHPLLTNELPFGDSFDQAPLIPKVFPPEGDERDSPSRRHRRRRRKHHRKRGKGDDDNLIPLPENYSKVKWGESERRRKNKRRRRNRKLPDDWMAAAQNTLSNDANSINFGAGIQGALTSTRPCERHNLSVDFKTLGWDHWIIAPAGFNAYYCAGVCPNPLTKPSWRSEKVCKMSGSNHAIIQSMIYSMGLSPEVPAPCCVPDKLDAATILFLDEDGRFVLRGYSKMIVSSCSCQ